MLVIDYGFPRHEYYHPQRSDRHADGPLPASRARRSVPVAGAVRPDRARRFHGDRARPACARASTVAGFTTQAAFLLGCGILDRLRTIGAPESRDYLREASAVQKLLSPAEMGELFKVIALARSDDIAWPGFAMADMRQRL